MRNRMYGGVRGRKTKVGRKLLRFPPTRLWQYLAVRCTEFSKLKTKSSQLIGDFAEDNICISNAQYSSFSELRNPWCEILEF